MGDLYKQFHPRANLSIERFSERVPADGKYYVLKGAEIIGCFRSLDSAKKHYQKLVDALALPPLVEEGKKMSKERFEDLFLSIKKLTGYEYTSKPSGRNKHPN